MPVNNYQLISRPFSDLEAKLSWRLQRHFHAAKDKSPGIRSDSKHVSFFSSLIPDQHLNTDEYLLLLLALVPHVQPGLLSSLINQALPKAGDYPELGGLKDNQNRCFLPTGETAVFLLAGDELKRRFEILQMFGTEHWFYTKQILYLEAVPKGHPKMSGRLLMDDEYVELLTQGTASRPKLSTDFPARHISTELEWQDLVFNRDTMAQIQELQRWVQYNQLLLKDWGMEKWIAAGYRALFHGVSGTGKTHTASLLGKYTGKEVYKIDLSVVVSKYIGETEKNLSRLFDKAANKDWILFFDEADALFGKRTSVRDAHDKYANQEVSYLLQRIESFPGLTILATNFKSNIDDAFLRRFQSVIYFPVPGQEERLRLWQRAFPIQVTISPEVDFKKLAQMYSLTGAHIMNITQYSCLCALEAGDQIIQLKYILAAIHKEYEKEGKTMV